MFDVREREPPAAVGQSAAAVLARRQADHVSGGRRATLAGATVVDTSVPHFAQPVTVVRDDADALVVWQPTGAPVLRADGLGKRDDTSTLFTAELAQDCGVHADFDQLRVAPTGRPWSVWVFFTEGTGEFAPSHPPIGLIRDRKRAGTPDASSVGTATRTVAATTVGPPIDPQRGRWRGRPTVTEVRPSRLP
ncbi:MAG: hypothetical protein H0U15_06785 [Geodermatophilaceae bacterium]|nr:hypothetical protein [Geodermatophilaceae bacterium]